MWNCPKCKSDSLNVRVAVVAQLIQYGEDNFETNTDDTDHEWGSESSMQCNSCGHTDRAGSFAVEGE